MNAGPVIGDYEVEYRQTGTTDWTSHAHVGAATETAIGGLLEDTEYQVRVRAANAEGTGGWSEIGTGSTRAVNAPGRPLAPTFGDTTATTVVVNWLEPANPGSAITDYDVRYREVTTPLPSWTDAGHTGTARTVTLTGLTAGASYEVQVLATNAEGDSPWSPSGRATAAANSAPVFGLASFAFDLAENADGSTTRIILGAAQAIDADAGHTVSYFIVAGNTGSVFNVGRTNGATAYTGSGEDFESFTDPASAFTLIVRASDGHGGSADATVTVAVTDVNEPPVFDTSGLTTDASGTVLFSVAENGTAVSTLTASDPDAADTTVTYTLGGTDHDLFSIGADGAIAFTNAPDFETPGCGPSDNSNTCTFTVTATAGGSGREMSSLARTVIVTVTDVNEPPAFDTSALTLDANGIAQFSVAENTTAVGTVTAADPDAADTTVSYRLGGTDAALFSIGTDGAIAFKAGPDFEDPKGGAADDSNTYEFSVTAATGAGARSKLGVIPVQVTVTDVSGGAPREACGADGGRDRGVADQPRRALDGAG